MNDLLQVRNFQNMLRKELSYRNMAALNATSRGGRGMFDTDAYVSHMAALHDDLKEYFQMVREHMKKERQNKNNVNQYLGKIPPSLNRLFMATRSEIPSKQTELVFTIALLVLAAADMYPWFRQAWDELTKNRLPDQIQRAFYIMGLDFLFRFAQVSKYVEPKRLLKFVSPYLMYIEKNKFKTDIYISLDSAIEYAKSKILHPLAEWMDNRDRILKKRQDIIQSIEKTGDSRIMREFNEIELDLELESDFLGR